MRMAECCPEKKLFCKGLCSLCYSRTRAPYFAKYKKANPEDWQERKNDPVQRERDVKIWKWKALRRNYGLSKDEYLRMLDGQGYACKICRRLFSDLRSDKKRTPENVDHCHSSGKVRGILCHNCNAGLGHFKDSAQSLQSAIEYLAKSKLESSLSS